MHPDLERIVVGVDDSSVSQSAIDWAADLAWRTGAPLTLVHAFPDVLQPPSRGFANLDRELRAVARQILVRAEHRVQEIHGGAIPVRRIQAPGTPRHVLLEASKNARMLVVGRRGRGGFLDLLIGSTAYGVAEHARTAVVVIPQEWSVEEARQLPVILGLDDQHDTDALTFAFEVASVTSRRLVAVHVCPPLASPYLAADLYGPAHEGWVSTQRDLVMERLCLAKRTWPTVTIETRVAVGHSVGTLLDAAVGSQLLVVGAQHRGRVVLPHLGSVADRLLHHISGPMAVVPVSAVPSPSTERDLSAASTSA
jgi:nucleotide-binding universal stress UspA family protein